MGTLIVIRHAKTEPSATTDFVRELTARGRKDAGAVGSWLSQQGYDADLALVSAARRARQTWVRVADTAGWRAEPNLEASLYAADADDVLDLVRQVDGAETVAVIGHNPTMHSFVATLDDGEGDAAAREQLAEGFPTSTVAVLDVPVAWADLTPNAATVRAVHTARG